MASDEEFLCQIQKKIAGVEKRRARLILELIHIEGGLANLKGFLENESKKGDLIQKVEGPKLVMP